LQINFELAILDADQLVRWKDQEPKNWQFGDEQAFKSVGLNTKIDDATVMQSIGLLGESQGRVHAILWQFRRIVLILSSLLMLSPTH